MAEIQDMVSEESWEEFQDSGCLWWANRILHLVGWAIIIQIQDDGRIQRVYPARVKFRGFAEHVETEGFRKLTQFVADNIQELKEATE